MKRRVQRPAFDIPTFVFLIALVLVSSWSLEVADWTAHLSTVALVSVFGVALGVVLARTVFSGPTSAILSACYGVLFVGWQIAGNLDPGLNLQDRYITLYYRIQRFIQVVGRGEPSDDPLIFVIAMAALYWGLGSLAGWMVFRRNNLWPAVLPSGVVILANAYFYFGSANLSLYLAAYVFLALLLLTRVDQNIRQEHWEKLRARVPSETSYHVSRAGVIAALVLVGLSWTGPAIARYENVSRLWRTISQPWNRTREVLSDALSSLRSPNIAIVDHYGDELLLDSGSIPEPRLIMEVQPERLPGEGGRFYWRSRTYDFYHAGRWSTTTGTAFSFNPGDGNLPLQTSSAREVIEVTFYPELSAISSLYLPSQPVWVNRTADVYQSRIDGDLVDVHRFVAKRVVVAGEPYRARAAVAQPTGQQLRTAGENYPDWVTGKYLQMSNSVSPRVGELAAEITENVVSPYDKAVAITNWLRSNIEYSRATESPPADEDPLTWFLFDYQIGFCNYYASAEVIMLRSLGIPARLAAGYARGTFDFDRQLYRVAADDAHAWPEVYFPGYGWIEFEPTVSQSTILRPEPIDDTGGATGLGTGAGPTANEEGIDRVQEIELPEEEAEVEGVGPQNPFPTKSVLLGLALFILVVVLWVRYNPSTWAWFGPRLAQSLVRVGVEPPEALRAVRGVPTTLTGRIYLSWTTWLGRIGLTLSPAQTPYERAASFASVIPESAQAGWEIVESYSRERFGHRDIDEESMKRTWRALRPRLLLAWIWRWTARWRDKQASS